MFVNELVTHTRALLQISGLEQPSKEHWDQALLHSNSRFGMLAEVEVQAGTDWDSPTVLSAIVIDQQYRTREPEAEYRLLVTKASWISVARDRAPRWNAVLESIRDGDVKFHVDPVTGVLAKRMAQLINAETKAKRDFY